MVGKPKAMTYLQGDLTELSVGVLEMILLFAAVRDSQSFMKFSTGLGIMLEGAAGALE